CWVPQGAKMKANPTPVSDSQSFSRNTKKRPFSEIAEPLARGDLTLRQRFGLQCFASVIPTSARPTRDRHGQPMSPFAAVNLNFAVTLDCSLAILYESHTAGVESAPFGSNGRRRCIHDHGPS